MTRFREIEDARALRALAHPLRLRLLGSLRREGPGTASVLARSLGESSGATSYHLRVLARYGFIEDEPDRNRGRERWWRASDHGVQWSLDSDDVDLLEAERQVGRHLAAEHLRWVERWYREMPGWDRKWRAAASSTDRSFELTAVELRKLSNELLGVLERYGGRRAQDRDTERVLVVFHAFPQGPGEM